MKLTLSHQAVAGSVLALVMAASTVFAASMSPAQKATYDKYAFAAKAASPAFTEFSASRGQAFFATKQSGGKPDTPSCTTCHTADPKKSGQTRAGKAIEPMAISVNPKRFNDPADVEKWFRRNCADVLGRECTALEKGDFLAFMFSE